MVKILIKISPKICVQLLDYKCLHGKKRQNLTTLSKISLHLVI